MATGRARPKIVALMVVPMVWPICRVVSNIPEAKLRFSSRVFITTALLAVLKRLEPIPTGNNRMGSPQTGRSPAKNPTRIKPNAISESAMGRSQRGL